MSTALASSLRCWCQNQASVQLYLLLCQRIGTTAKLTLIPELASSPPPPPSGRLIRSQRAVLCCCVKWIYHTLQPSSHARPNGYYYYYCIVPTIHCCIFSKIGKTDFHPIAGFGLNYGFSVPHTHTNTRTRSLNAHQNPDFIHFSPDLCFASMAGKNIYNMIHARHICKLGRHGTLSAALSLVERHSNRHSQSTFHFWLSLSVAFVRFGSFTLTHSGSVWHDQMETWVFSATRQI